MKKLSLLMSVIAMVTMLVSCGETVEEDDTVSGTKWNLIDSKLPTTPDWVSGMSWSEETWNGSSVVAFIVEGQGNDLYKAQNDAQLERIETMARAIKELSTAKLGMAAEGLLNDDEEVDQYFQETIAAVSQNANTSGAMMTGEFWMHGEYIYADGTVEEVYRVFQKYVIDAAQLQAAMDEAWESTKKDYPEELVNEVDDTIGSLMDASDAMTE